MRVNTNSVIQFGLGLCAAGGRAASAFLAVLLICASADAASPQAPTQNPIARSASASVVPETRNRTWSGFPTPRFVSLKGGRTNCRIGPSRSHRIKFVYQRAGLPVMVIAETRDKWRKIRDADGDECWAFHTTLTSRSHVIVSRATAVYARRDPAAHVRAHLTPGAIIAADGAARPNQDALWIHVKAAGVEGWTPAADVWGGDVEAERRRRPGPREAFAAPPD